MQALPEKARPYKRTPLFTEETLPRGLLKDHRTREGVWGVIRVEEGMLEYCIGEGERYLLTPGNPGIVAPEVTHHITPQGKVAFFIEFCREEAVD